MYKIYALWSEPEEKDGFEDHYLNIHLPLAATLPGLRQLVAVRTTDGVAVHGSPPPPHYRVAELAWEDKRALEECQRSREWEELVADGARIIARFNVSVDNAAGETLELAPR